MLQCQRCHQRFDEYYRMSDGIILCKDCWRDELNLAEMKAIQGRQQRAQVLRDKDAFDQKRKADKVTLEQLKHAIELEKGKCRSAWSSWDDGYRTDKPYNYEEVELLKRQYWDLKLNQNQRFKFPSTPPFLDNTAYYRTAQFISKSESHYFETVTLPAEQEAKRKAEEERIRAEQEAERKRIKAEEDRIRAEQEAEQKRIADELARKKKEDELRRIKDEELKPYEDDILAKKKLPRQLRVKVAKETFREEVMLQCVDDKATSVVDALKYNPNITDKVRKAIYEKKEAEKKKLAEEKAKKEAERLEEEQKKERIKTTIWWIVGLAIAAGLIFLVVQYWETILAILVIIFLLFLFLK